MTDLNMRQYCGSNYVKADDLRAGPRREIIAKIAPGQKFDRPEATFRSGAIVSLNKTSIKTLIDAYGENSRDWIGCEVELYVGQVPFNNTPVDSVLIRPITPPRNFDERTPPPPLPERTAMDDEIPF